MQPFQSYNYRRGRCLSDITNAENDVSHLAKKLSGIDRDRKPTDFKIVFNQLTAAKADLKQCKDNLVQFDAENEAPVVVEVPKKEKPPRPEERFWEVECPTCEAKIGSACVTGKTETRSVFLAQTRASKKPVKLMSYNSHKSRVNLYVETYSKENNK